MNDNTRKFMTYTGPINNGFRMRMDTSFANDCDLDKAWDLILDGLVANLEAGKWQGDVSPSALAQELRAYFECNSVYDVMRLGNEAVFIKLERASRYATATLRPRMGVRELIPRKAWSIELVDKDLLVGVVSGEAAEKSLPLQNTFAFPYPDKNKVGQLWGITKQPDGIVHVVERIKPAAHDLTPTPISLYNPLP